LKRALEVHERYFFDHSQSMPTESYALDFTDPEDYRGINAAMHTVEAYLAIADATGDDRWLERALGIVDFAINQQARAHGWRIPEHYSTTWVPDPDYNIDEVAHPFRPFGITPGHGLEWARLTVQLRAALQEVGLEAPAWMLPAALELFTRSRADGWNRDGAPGFVYTVDFVGTPVVHERMHWVTCEAISAAAALHCALVNEPVALAAKATSMAYLEHAYRSAWDYCEQYIIGGGDPFTRAEIDPQNAPLDQAGAWVHELDQSNQPSTRTWAGYPDIYHALQATLIPRVPVWPVLPGALRDGLLDR
ncbi:MAG: AGE family epimerase/isomerase, partial [Actinomyces graevenitzii]|nr:AGE family epimerase/isomerase [Actinomyces graevenitzii]